MSVSTWVTSTSSLMSGDPSAVLARLPAPELGFPASERPTSPASPRWHRSSALRLAWPPHRGGFPGRRGSLAPVDPEIAVPSGTKRTTDRQFSEGAGREDRRRPQVLSTLHPVELQRFPRTTHTVCPTCPACRRRTAVRTIGAGFEGLAKRFCGSHRSPTGPPSLRRFLCEGGVYAA